MAGLILDASGTIKMKVLDDALLMAQRLNALNEQFAVNTKSGAPSSSLKAAIKRQMQTLAANLKSHFGMISDLVNNVVISSSRGSSDVNRVRAIREGLAQIRQGIDIGMVQTRQKHAMVKAKPVAKPATES
jgi:hypothetical protein